MSWLKGFMLGAVIVVPISLFAATPLLADPSATAAKSDAVVNPVVAKSDDDGDKTSEADKRAKAVECSKQADAKKLHGEARKKFRSSCKREK